MGSESVASGLLTFALHACVLMTIAWLVDRGRFRAQLAWRELLWRGALFGGLLTAGVQTYVGPPLPARIVLASAVQVPVPVPVATSAVRELAVPPAAAARRVQTDAPATRAAGTARVVPAPTVRATLDANPAEAAWPSWHAIVVAGWFAGVLMVLARLALALAGLARRIAEAQPLDLPVLAADAASLAIAAGTATPRLAISDAFGSPVAAIGRRILLPGWALQLLDRDQQAAMLAHEIAHLARRDPLWKLLAAFCGALLWFLPLARLARRRLDEIAELRCDHWAAAHLGDGRALAECLAECATHQLEGIDAGLVPAMAHRDSPLLERIDHLIEGKPLDTTYTSTRAAFACAFVLAVAVLVLPGVSAQAQAPTPPPPPVAPEPPTPPDGDVRFSHRSGGMFGLSPETTTVEIQDFGERYGAWIRGKVEFNDRDDDIVRMEDGATARFEHESGGTTRRIDYARRDDAIERHCYVDGREQPLDDAGKTCIADAMATIVRETAINAGPRVQRIHAAGGPDAVLAEIGKMKSAHARVAHLHELYPLAKLTQAQATRVIDIIDRIDSDYDMRIALADLSASDPLDAGRQLLVLTQAGDIGSDYERAELLVGMLADRAPAEPMRKAWLEAVTGIGSDYELARTLKALLEAGTHDDQTVTAVIAAADAIDSDYELRSVLVSAIERSADADRIASPYTAAASRIGSDYEQREALVALARAPKFGMDGARAVLDAAAGIGSDYERSQVLVEVARVMPHDAALIARYREVARDLDDHERGVAERALDRFAD